MIISTASNTVPLCFLPYGPLLCYRNGKIVLLCRNQEEKTIPIPISFKERLLGKCRWAIRLFRFGVRAAEVIDEQHVVLSIGGCLHELNIEGGALTSGWRCDEGVRPLLMTTVKNINGFDDGIYFGGYLVNMEKKPVNIYRRISIDRWKIVYTFPQGTINHVHCVIADPYRQCLWVFTGDFDESAAIWKVTNNFQKVELVACNDQKYRGCVVFALPEGLLYATDAPFTENYIYLMDTETYEAKPLFSLHGSCIYGCQWKNDYVFSSTVEGDGRNVSWLEFLFGRRRGAGIKDDYVHMYKGNPTNGFQEIYKEIKDNLPFVFQFGVFKFPCGLNTTDTLYFQPVATKKNDLKLMNYKGI